MLSFEEDVGRYAVQVSTLASFEAEDLLEYVSEDVSDEEIVRLYVCTDSVCIWATVTILISDEDASSVKR